MVGEAPPFLIILSTDTSTERSPSFSISITLRLTTLFSYGCLPLFPVDGLISTTLFLFDYPSLDFCLDNTFSFSLSAISSWISSILAKFFIYLAYCFLASSKLISSPNMILFLAAGLFLLFLVLFWILTLLSSFI